ncbi:hypothetical protein M011DRAFT_62073 [Sporormia fimetaria CBS 119925]|uniref:Uncharacterized protein n=1 Tax=Sporormia fimetaria CBS 119925 TaxID=1340428 RepID=A0A6A6V8W6_9PLEO|nr:hypothetical protein M011DRAFT_62073 [Sporormia fimetaria CBS 119925]
MKSVKRRHICFSAGSGGVSQSCLPRKLTRDTWACWRFQDKALQLQCSKVVRGRDTYSDPQVLEESHPFTSSGEPVAMELFLSSAGALLRWPTSHFTQLPGCVNDDHAH